MTVSPARLGKNDIAGLRSLADCGGCAAKAGPELVALLAQVAASHGQRDAAVLSGLDRL